MVRGSSARVLLLVTCVVAARPAAALAQDDDGAATKPLDYDPVSDSWNGLSSLVSVARGSGLEVEVTSRFEWNDLGGQHVLFLLYPEQRIEPGHLAAFIRNGGYVLLADDFGDSSEALGRLGILRDTAVGVGAQTFHDGRPYAPIATPLLPSHPLAAGVSELVTNHPSIFRDVRGPEVVFGFGKGEGVVVAGALGRGRFVMVSDASVFINRMLEFPGNMQFAINALRFLSRDETTDLIILTGEFELWGEPVGLLDDGTTRGKVANAVAGVNRWLDERNDYLLTEPGLRGVAALLALLIGLLAVVALPLTRRARLDGRWVRARPGETALEGFPELVAHYDGPGRASSYLLPATVLRDTVNTAMARALDHPDPLYSLGEDDLASKLRDACNNRVAAAARKLYKRLKKLPSRVQAASPWTQGFLSRREFEALHVDAEALLAGLAASTESPSTVRETSAPS